MSGLAFLAELPAQPADVFKTIIQALVSGQFTYNVPPLTQAQVQKIVHTAKFLAAQPPGERAALLEGVGCPRAGAVAAVLDAYAPFLVPKSAIHDLRDFDWSASVVLGTSTISNIKEPVATFRFDISGGAGGLPGATSRTIELTAEEAQQLLAQLDAARSAQKELLVK
jgi:hypothetical protein